MSPEDRPEPASEASQRGAEGDVKMSLWEHLGELRNRLRKAFIALALTAVIAWVYRVQILQWIILPYENAWVARGLPGKPELLTLSPADPFIGYFQLSVVAGLVAAAPVMFYQLWAFISPGLYKKEKRLIVPFVVFSTTLFLSGVSFAYYVAFPFTFSYFFSLLGPVGDGGTVLTQRPTLEYYLDFSTRFLLSFGAVFELPLFISFLVIGNIVTPRQLLRFSRWAILLSFIVGAIVTPGPEVTSQLAVSLALIALYFLSLLIAYAIRPRSAADRSSS